MPNETHAPRLRDPRWLAEYLDVPLTTIFSWKCRGKLPGVVQVSPRIWRVREDVILAWLEERRTAGSQER